MNFDNYIFRCHMVGKIICPPSPLTEKQTETLGAYRDRISGNGKPLTEKQTADWHSLEHKYNESLKYKLTDTAKKELNNLVFQAKHKRTSSLDVKYLEKGLVKEKESRDLLSEVLGVLLPSDEERKTNEWVTGKRDIKSDEVMIDIKSSWSYESFNNHLISKPNEIYLRQLDSYMDLWGIKDSLLCHILVDTPSNLVDDEIKRLDWKYNIINNEGNIRDDKVDQVKELVTNHIFTEKGLNEYLLISPFFNENDRYEMFSDFIELEKKDRIHMIAHPFDKARIEQRNESIILARKYMNTVQPINNIIK